MLFQYIHDLIDYQHDKYAKEISVSQFTQSESTKYSTADLIKLIDQQCRKWITLGLRPRDQVGISAASGSVDWLICDLSLMKCGIIPVNIHTNYLEQEIQQVFLETEFQILLLDNEDLISVYESINPDIKLIGLNQNVTALYYRDISESPLSTTVQNDPDSLATIIYTSGTSGDPKGVMLSHNNILSNVTALISLTPINYKSVVFSFLPISHVFERTVVYSYLASGATINFISEPKNILKYIQTIRPNFMTSVPRILEKLYDQIRTQSADLPLLQRRLIKWAMKQGMHEQKGNFLNRLVDHFKTFLADLLVYRRWRKALGGRIKGVGVGAAALNPDLGRLFNKAGIPIREGYGLTETSPIVTFNRFEPGGVRFGTAGIAIPGVEIKIIDEIDDEGEILVKGPNVMIGYYKNPSLTAFKIDKDGWFHTGDIGKVVDKRFLKITDRKKDIFKSSSGKYIAPQVIENKLRSNSMIDQCLIIGFQKPFVTALILPNFERLRIWCSHNNVHWTSPQYMVINPRVESLFANIVNTLNESLKSHERIITHHLLFKEWTVKTGQYTATLKIKRATVENQFKKEIEAMYAQN